MTSLRLGELTTEECAALLRAPHPVVLLPVGSTEPHGPHLPLATDAILSERACEVAASRLREANINAVVAPALPYGVTRYAAGFAGAVSLSPETTERILEELSTAWISAGFERVCVVNNHLEPAHVEALARAVAKVPGALFANQLTRRWGRTLSDEFRRGDCHAGSYETSLVLAARPDLVREEIRATLAPVPISLSVAIREGRHTFLEMGADRAYFGTPTAATRDEGEGLYDRLATMIVTEVRESIEGARAP
ncbi:MAG: creatininase family protein [Polyangiales bacterium]